MPQHFPLPDVGEGLTEAEILNWRVQPGDAVTLNQVIVEIETAKAAVELPCPYAGTVTELLAEPGQTVEVGTPIISIEQGSPGQDSAVQAAKNGSNGSGSAPTSESSPGQDTGEVANLVGYGPRPSSARRRRRAAVPAQADTEPPSEPTPVAPEPRDATASATVPLAKPPVRKLAKDLGVELEQLRGSGSDGVITREDVQQAAAGQQEQTSVPPVSPASGGERREPIRGVRKATAQAMVASAFTAPHVTEFLTVDVTPLMEFRARLQQEREFSDVKLTPLAFAAKAVCLAARRTPEVNARWDEAAQEIVFRDYVHLGIAAATPRGLVVPKVRNVEQQSLAEIAGSLQQLATTAREGKTPPADMVNGTFTITNVGVFGVDTGTPILTPGESAILALGAIREMPWVVDGQVVPRQVCQLALSFDHRVVDGQQGSEFLRDVGMLLSDPAYALVL